MYDYSDIPEGVRISDGWTDYTAKKRILIRNLYIDINGTERFFPRIGMFLDIVQFEPDRIKRKRKINKIFSRILAGDVVFYGCVLIKYDLVDPEEDALSQPELFQ